MSKITVTGVIQEGIGIGLKNFVSLFAATLLWIVTIWIPYLNVGTTIAMTTIPIELSKGKVISPLFIFDAKYRKYMGEYFILIGLIFIALIPAFSFMIIPGYVVSLAWSLAIYIMLDKGVSPTQALVQSNKATYGYKWTIFFVNLILMVAFSILFGIFKYIPFIGWLFILASFLLLIVGSQGCMAVIYRELTKDEATPVEPIAIDTPATEV